MSDPAAEDLDELRLTLRPVEGGKCAQCGQPVGLAQLNGHTFQVAPKALVIQGGTILLALHLCQTTGPKTQAKTRRKP